MVQPDRISRRENASIMLGMPETVTMPVSGKTYRIYPIKPYTIERLTALWIDKENAMRHDNSDSSGCMRSMCIEPYFALKEAILFILNSYWKIRLLSGIMLWWWKIKGVTEEDVTGIIAAGKKKIPLYAHWMNMAFSVDMRADWMALTSKEAEQFQAELTLAAEQHSAKSIQNSQGQSHSSLG